MATAADRLKAERVRLKYSQEAFGEAAGVGKHSQIHYEKGRRSPDVDYLAAVGALGADVLFIVTGHRQPYLAESDDLRDAHLTPARRLAGDIASMNLSREDAELLLNLAQRLCPPQ